MNNLPDRVIEFLREQSFVIVSTIDKNGLVHNSCKGLVNINNTGQVYLLDLYKSRTFENLNRNPSLSITSVDEHRFIGYCLKGKGKIVENAALNPEIIADWEARITSRLSKRLIKNIRGEKGSRGHPEAVLPKPEYMIVMAVEEIVDLSPHKAPQI